MATTPGSGWRNQTPIGHNAASFADGDMRRPPNLMKTASAPEPIPSVPAEPGPPANYLDLYGLSKPPFGGATEATGYILFNSHRRAFELLVEHMVNGAGVVLLEGEEGIGKTETLQAAAAVAAEQGLRTVIVSRPPSGRLSLSQFTAALLDQPNAGQRATEDAIGDFIAPPRKALLADDIDLMPPECLGLLLSLAQRLQNEPGGLSIVLAGSAVASGRPDLSELVALASNTIRLPRLTGAEVRQYVERALWIAGGTTRRLLTQDAMKLMIARSGGVPGLINRLMEAVFTAGFARGDAIITGKTVAAAMGPVAPRPRPSPRPEPSGVIPLLAVGVLIIGASVFLYKGLTGQPPAPPKPVITQPASSPGAAAQKAPPGTSDALSADLITALLKRGDQSLALGDIAAARLLYQRAADAGNATAATSLGKTYDPNFAAPGGQADPYRAAFWYQKAIGLGDPHAGDLLKGLIRR